VVLKEVIEDKEQNQVIT
jgi:hypothetical protein